MRFFVLLLACSLVLICGHVHFTLSANTISEKQPADQLGEQMVGAWRLVSVETVRPSGEIIYPFYGRHPEGLLIYDRSGWMSVQIVSDPKPTLPLSDSREGSWRRRPPKR